MKSKLFIAVLVSSFLMTSCATIFTGSKDTIRFNSNPTGAKVYIDGLEVCTTPCSVKVKRSLSDKMAEIKLNGYQTRIITLDKKFNVVSILNLGGILGWAIDAATGSIMKYDRKGYDLTLEKDKSISSLLKNPSKIDINTQTETVNVYVTGGKQ